MKDILSEIIAHKQTEIELQSRPSLGTVGRSRPESSFGRHNCRSMKQALAASSTGIISEFKRRSPSKGWINEAARQRKYLPPTSRRRRRPPS